MERHLSIDIETFSSVDIKKSGLYKYAQSPDFEILLFAYSFDGQPVRVIDLAQGDTLPSEIIYALQDPNIIKHAYNSSFEWYCLNKFFYSPLDQWRCTMLHGLYCGYTAGLGPTAIALGLPEDKKKMGIGSALIRIFCVPCKPTQTNGQRTRNLPRHEPEKWQLFKEYCRQDVVTEMEIERRLSSFPVPDQEQALWVLDQQSNAYGVAVDLDLIEGALHCDAVSTGQLMHEAIEISGLDNPKSVQQLSKWLTEETGEEVTDLTKGNVKKLIKSVDSETARRMLEIRQELAKTSVKKYAAMREAVCGDGRIRGLLQFYGANRTGRWAGRLVQVQNLPQNHLTMLDWARRTTKAKDVELIKALLGNTPDTLSQLIRTAFIPSVDRRFVIADFSAIEARVIAWLAGEEWRLEVFRTHGKIYEASASQMFGVPLELIKKGNPEYALRQKGKVSELALGYQGGANALKKMGALEMGLTEEELPEIVQLWRGANRRIVDLWYKVENAANEVVKNGNPVGVKGLLFARELESRNGQDFLTITLPSGRKLFYVKPHFRREEHREKDPETGEGKLVTNPRESLHYWGMDQTTKKWTVIPTYGGKLVENIIQAIARDCLAVNMQRIYAAGYPIVMHVHDEIIADVPNGSGSVDEMCAIMGQPIPWAPGLPLKAAGFESSYYKKDD